ncbi:proline-rich protein 18-like [Zalophus californianus]|uniref:Proline-rich protein 18-like n=1 Tax=Zalophus californianus TaxID=9704 RepID=A0A6J2ECZ6_ZALCA|nr:proline-rich protein 18-like [Zalophus californianus]
MTARAPPPPPPPPGRPARAASSASTKARRPGRGGGRGEPPAAPGASSARRPRTGARPPPSRPCASSPALPARPPGSLGSPPRVESQPRSRHRRRRRRRCCRRPLDSRGAPGHLRSSARPAPPGLLCYPLLYPRGPHLLLLLLLRLPSRRLLLPQSRCSSSFPSRGARSSLFPFHHLPPPSSPGNRAGARMGAAASVRPRATAERKEGREVGTPPELQARPAWG